jgi:hypothetical protein
VHQYGLPENSAAAAACSSSNISLEAADALVTRLLLLLVLHRALALPWRAADAANDL